MKLSLNWLSDYVVFSETDPYKIADALTCSVAEVEEVEVQGKFLENCVIGKVITITKHPDADKLQLCDVETDLGTKRIVCGGTNLREGMLTAVAHVGAVVNWHGMEVMELKPVKIRGEKSEGMICAAEELGLSELFPECTGHSIIDLGDDGYTVGTSLKEAFGLTDIVFHIDNHAITHRADLFSHIGFARECVAIGLGTWKQSATFDAPSFTDDPIPCKTKLTKPELTPRYCACLIQIDALGETPDWMKRRLEAVGFRSLNLPIDITNYVASEVGVPLHSFDAEDIKGTITCRTTKAGEKIVTLDKQERTLQEGAIILEDDEGVFDLMGIMGGLRASTQEKTRNIYLHSMSVDPVSIRKTIIATGLRTDAATVYEKGVPHITAEQGFYRAAQLMLELIPGAKIVSAMESKGDNGSPQPIMLDPKRVSSLLGRELSIEEISTALSALGCTAVFEPQLHHDPQHHDPQHHDSPQHDPQHHDPQHHDSPQHDPQHHDPQHHDSPQHGPQQLMLVTPPLHRLGDISEAVDLIEEVARITSFASYEPLLPTASIMPPERDHRIHAMRDALKEGGYIELRSFSFLGAELLRRSGITEAAPDVIENPISEDMSIMRPSLLPRILETASENIRTVECDLRHFEAGTVFRKGTEEKHLLLLHVQKEKGGLEDESSLHVKEMVRHLFDSIGQDVKLESKASDASFMHPGRVLSIILRGKEIGSVYELHPGIASAFDFPHRAAVAEVNLSIVLCGSSQDAVYRPIPSFPQIIYDTTVAVPSDVAVRSLLHKAKESHELMKDVHLSKLFEKDGKRFLTFRCTYGADDRTLTEEEVKPVHKTVELLLEQ